MKQKARKWSSHPKRGKSKRRHGSYDVTVYAAECQELGRAANVGRKNKTSQNITRFIAEVFKGEVTRILGGISTERDFSYYSYSSCPICCRPSSSIFCGVLFPYRDFCGRQSLIAQLPRSGPISPPPCCQMTSTPILSFSTAAH